MITERESLAFLSAGAILDSLIHEQVMKRPLDDDLPCYSADLATAWQVVDYSLKQAGGWGFHSLMEGWTANFFVVGRSDLVSAHGDTPAEAICRAALKVIEHRR